MDYVAAVLQTLEQKLLFVFFISNFQYTCMQSVKCCEIFFVQSVKDFVFFLSFAKKKVKALPLAANAVSTFFGLVKCMLSGPEK